MQSKQHKGAGKVWPSGRLDSNRAGLEFDRVSEAESD